MRPSLRALVFLGLSVALGALLATTMIVVTHEMTLLRDAARFSAKDD